MNWVKTVIGGLLGSKKFIGLVVSAVLLLAAKYKLNIDEATITKLVIMVSVWLGAQGAADFGKEAAKQ